MSTSVSLSVPAQVQAPQRVLTFTSVNISMACPQEGILSLLTQTQQQKLLSFSCPSPSTFPLVGVCTCAYVRTHANARRISWMAKLLQLLCKRLVEVSCGLLARTSWCCDKDRQPCVASSGRLCRKSPCYWYSRSAVCWRLHQMRVYCLQVKQPPALWVLVENQTLVCLSPSLLFPFSPLPLLSGSRYTPGGRSCEIMWAWVLQSQEGRVSGWLLRGTDWDCATWNGFCFLGGLSSYFQDSKRHQSHNGCSGDRLGKVHEQSDLSFRDLLLAACEKQHPGFNTRSVQQAAGWRHLWQASGPRFSLRALAQPLFLPLELRTVLTSAGGVPTNTVSPALLYQPRGSTAPQGVMNTIYLQLKFCSKNWK